MTVVESYWMRKWLDVLLETGQHPPKIDPHPFGGYIKINPDPDKVFNSPKMSIAYINQKIAKFYGVQDSRVIGYDTHGHTGKYEPHFHILQKTKSNVISINHLNIKNYNNEIATEIFYGLLEIIIEIYIRDKKNEKN